MIPAPVIRIVLRYAAGILIAKGWLLPDDAYGLINDPATAEAIQLGAGFIIMVGVEVWYYFAKKWSHET